jgi:hypothetical protein
MALTTVFALMFRKGIASGKRVLEHIKVSRYSLPALVLGKGPTQSMTILEKGSSNTGIGLKGALGIVWFGFPAN